MSIDLMPGFGAFSPSGLVLPSFPAASAIQAMASPNWAERDADTDVTTGQVDPTGGTAAVSIVANTVSAPGNDNVGFSGNPQDVDAGFTIGSYADGSTYTVSFYALALAGGTWCRVGLFGASLGDAGCYFNIATGGIGDFRASGVTESNAGVIDYGSGWRQFYFSFVMAGTSAPTSHQIGIRTATNTNFDSSGTNNAIGDGFRLFRYQIVSGTNPNG